MFKLGIIAAFVLLVFSASYKDASAATLSSGPCVGVYDVIVDLSVSGQTTYVEDYFTEQRVAVIGTSGDDVIIVRGLGDCVAAGDGNDQIAVKPTEDYLEHAARLYGEGGNDIIQGGGNNDRLFGGDGDDEIDGRQGNDYIDGGVGTDKLVGGTGTDRCLNGEVFVYNYLKCESYS